MNHLGQGPKPRQSFVSSFESFKGTVSPDVQLYFRVYKTKSVIPLMVLNIFISYILPVIVKMDCKTASVKMFTNYASFLEVI